MNGLPTGFEVLEPYVAQWAVEGTAKRAALRGTSTREARVAFYDTATPLLKPALDYLDTKDLARLDERDQRLMDLMLSLAHVSLAVEIQAEDEDKHTPNRDAMMITRAPADLPPA
jgi:hypothetical protein